MDSPAQTTKIEILMAVYKPSLEFFSKQIESIRKQTYPNWRLTLIIDGAENELPEIIRAVTDGDPRIQREILPRHVGSCRTFEHGLRGLKGQVCRVALADQDDIWHPEKLELLEKALRLNPAAVMVCCDSSIIDGQDAVISTSLYDSEKRVPSFSIASLLARNSISGHAMLFGSELLDDAIPFSESLHTMKLHHDHWLAMVAALRGRIHFIKQPLVAHRLHGGNQIGPRIRRAGTKAGGYASWKAHNWHLRRVLEGRYQLLGGLPGFSRSFFGRRLLLGWAVKALFDGNPRAVGIYIRAICTPHFLPEVIPVCR